MNFYRCRVCGALWVRFADLTWSLVSPFAMMGKCCDNSVNFLAIVDQISDQETLTLLREAEAHRFAAREKAAGKP